RYQAAAGWRCDLDAECRHALGDPLSTAQGRPTIHHGRQYRLVVVRGGRVWWGGLGDRTGRGLRRQLRLQRPAADLGAGMDRVQWRYRAYRSRLRLQPRGDLRHADADVQAGRYGNA